MGNQVGHYAYGGFGSLKSTGVPAKRAMSTPRQTSCPSGVLDDLMLLPRKWMGRLFVASGAGLMLVGLIFSSLLLSALYLVVTRPGKPTYVGVDAQPEVSAVVGALFGFGMMFVGAKLVGQGRRQLRGLRDRGETGSGSGSA